MKPFTIFGETIGEPAFHPFEVPCCRLSALGLGGGGGLGSSGVGPNTSQSGGTSSITVNNGSGPSSTTWLIIAGIGAAALLIIGILFHGRR